MPAQLLALSDGPSILLDKPIMLFGRHPECDIQLNSRKVSRRHCCVAQVSDYLIVRDLGSTNGVRINGNRVAEGRLKNGDELMIGNFRYQVCWDTPAGGSSQPKPAASPKLGVPPSSSLEDELLEGCDDPVPLDDSPESVIRSLKPPSGKSDRPPVAPLIVSDHLNLLAKSDPSGLPPASS